MLTVADGRARQRETNGYDHGARDHGREETHDLVGAKHLEEKGHDKIEHRCGSNTQTGIVERHLVGETLRHTQLLDRGVASQEGEAGAKEGRNLHF